jgi:hypothetical protein
VGVVDQRQDPATLLPRKRLDGTQCWSGLVRKILPSLGFDSRTIQPVASGYAAYAFPALCVLMSMKSESLTLAFCVCVWKHQSPSWSWHCDEQFHNSYSHNTEWSVWMLDVNKRKAPWKHSSKLCITHLLLVLIILGCLLWDVHCACSRGGSTFSRLYAIRFICVGIVKNVCAQRHTHWWLTLNVAATFSRITTDVQNDTWEERAARWLNVEV